MVNAMLIFIVLSLHSRREVRSPNRRCNLGREGETGLACRAILTSACDEVLPVSKRGLKTPPGGNREICRKILKTYKNFYWWIYEQLLPCTWKPQTFKSFLVFAIYNVYVLSFCDPWPQGYFVQVIRILSEGSGASLQEFWSWLPFSLLCSLCTETGR